MSAYYSPLPSRCLQQWQMQLLTSASCNRLAPWVGTRVALDGGNRLADWWYTYTKIVHFVMKQHTILWASLLYHL